MKYEWRKKEKEFYIPKTRPELINVPEFKFLSIEGEGSPASKLFSDCIGTLYPIAYAIKMSPKKGIKLDGYYDYTVYPLEGIWDLNEEAKKNFTGKINKNDFVYKLMIRQPDFVTGDFVQEMVEATKRKKQLELLPKIKFEAITDGECIQMMHVGSYDNEAESFQIMENFAEKENYRRISKIHREIYLSDFRKTEASKLKTVLRFKVELKKS